tara:strand:+ start:1057 stop:2001 length:945 start_codon:yes stop_codon:yes gene_type:complete
VANLIKSIFDSESNYYKAPESDFSGFTASSRAASRQQDETYLSDYARELGREPTAGEALAFKVGQKGFEKLVPDDEARERKALEAASDEYEAALEKENLSQFDPKRDKIKAQILFKYGFRNEAATATQDFFKKQEYNNKISKPREVTERDILYTQGILEDSGIKFDDTNDEAKREAANFKEYVASEVAILEGQEMLKKFQDPDYEPLSKFDLIRRVSKESMGGNQEGTAIWDNKESKFNPFAIPETRPDSLVPEKTQEEKERQQQTFKSSEGRTGSETPAYSKDVANSELARRQRSKESARESREGGFLSRLFN